ncbi:MAG: MFS transporter [Sciscionella sp.]
MSTTPTGDSPRTATSATDLSLLLGRLDRIPSWSLSYLFIVVLGMGMLFIQYDIFDINVSFIQTCVAIKPGCTPANAIGFISLPVLVSLIGYAVGAVILASLTDRFGRRPMLMLTMALTGLGSLYTALTHDYTSFTVSRFVTGIGIGADLAIVNTYINEVAPRHLRAKYTSVLFVLAAVGSALGIWAGLVLTTPSAPWPQGLPFAIGGPSSTSGWRWMYGGGAILALLAFALRFQLPESPHWLLSRGRPAEAHKVITHMEQRALRRGPLPDPQPLDVPPGGRHGSYRDLLGSPRYLRRCLILAAAWLTGYVTLYGFGAGFTTVLSALGYSPATGGVIAAVGLLGFIAAAVFSVFFAERLERKHWLAVGAAIAIIGALVMALAGASLGIAFLGAAILYFGQIVWVAPQYSLTAESFPTHIRASGYAVADSIGHVGGGLGLFVIAGYVPNLSILQALLLFAGFLVIAAAITQFAPRTRNRRLEEVSPWTPGPVNTPTAKIAPQPADACTPQPRDE